MLLPQIVFSDSRNKRSETAVMLSRVRQLWRALACFKQRSSWAQLFRLFMTCPLRGLREVHQLLDSKSNTNNTRSSPEEPRTPLFDDGPTTQLLLSTLTPLDRPNSSFHPHARSTCTGRELPRSATLKPTRLNWFGELLNCSGCSTLQRAPSLDLT